SNSSCYRERRRKLRRIRTPPRKNWKGTNGCLRDQTLKREKRKRIWRSQQLLIRRKMISVRTCCRNRKSLVLFENVI
ncbi:hypothetical protein PMAYCL1PPCAC_01476, partial [Pristionchus mayeri]